MFSESHSPVIKIAFKDESVFPVISVCNRKKLVYVIGIHSEDWPRSIWQSEEFFELINYFQIGQHVALLYVFIILYMMYVNA